ncbi:MAG: hotdog fold thioesterase [Phycisphaerales bacterium]|nr:hotdog fold thioesterase [Phycisphaerales bacterium]
MSKPAGDLETVRAYFNTHDQLARQLGIEVVEVAPGRARARMRLEQKHYNGVSVAHGGAIFTLADLAFAAASNTHGTVALAINANISYLKAATAGVLTAEAEELCLTPKLGTYSVRIINEEQETIAVFQGTVYRKKDPLPLREG